MHVRLTPESFVGYLRLFRRAFEVELRSSSEPYALVVIYRNTSAESADLLYVEEELRQGKFFALITREGSAVAPFNMTYGEGRYFPECRKKWRVQEIAAGNAIDFVYRVRRQGTILTIGESEFETRGHDIIEARWWYHGKFSNLVPITDLLGELNG